MKALYQKLHAPAFGFFLIRVMAGIIFMVHGISKLNNMEGTIGFFASLGFGALLAWVVALIETLGGFALVIGYFSKFFAAALSIVLLVAIIKVKSHIGFGAAEIDLMLLATTLSVLFSGCGAYSVCNIGHKNCAHCSGGKCTCDCAMTK
jgi:putative oxidoreductase